MSDTSPFVPEPGPDATPPPAPKRTPRRAARAGRAETKASRPEKALPKKKRRKARDEGTSDTMSNDLSVGDLVKRIVRTPVHPRVLYTLCAAMTAGLLIALFNSHDGIAYRGPVWDVFKAGANGAFGLAFEGRTVLAVQLFAVLLGFLTAALLPRGPARGRWALFWFALATLTSFQQDEAAPTLSTVLLALAAGTLAYAVARGKGRQALLLCTWALLVCYALFPFSARQNQDMAGGRMDEVNTRYESWVTFLGDAHANPEQFLSRTEFEQIQRGNPDSKENIEIPSTFALHIRAFTKLLVPHLAMLFLLLTTLALFGWRPGWLGPLSLWVLLIAGFVVVIALRDMDPTEHMHPHFVTDWTRVAVDASARLWPWLLGLAAALADLGTRRTDEKAA